MKLHTRSLVLVISLGLLCSCAPLGSSSLSHSDLSSSETSSEASSLDFSLLPKWEEHDCFSYAYSYLGKDVMPIGGWCSPTGAYITDEQYALLKESGLNSIYGLYETYTNNRSDVDKTLVCSENNGVVYLPRDNSLGALCEDDSLLKARMDYYLAHPNVGGIFVADEPGANQFASLGKIVRKLRQTNPGQLVYLNAFPIYATANQLEGVGSGGTMTYDQYLDAYVKEIQPDVLSFDYYPFMGAIPNLSSSYFAQLYKTAAVANQYKIPFWPFIQACSFGGSSRVPSQAEMDWQVSTSLLYGAKGLQYFCYFQPLEFDASFGGNFIDKQGQKTAVYDAGKKINQQVARMDQVLMGSTLLKKMAFGTTPAPFLEQEKDEFVTSFRELQSVSTQDDIMIGCFDQGGRSAFLVVNNSTQKAGAASLTFTQSVQAKLYNPESTITAEGETLPIALGAGECSLVEITNYR